MTESHWPFGRRRADPPEQADPPGQADPAEPADSPERAERTAPAEQEWQAEQVGDGSDLRATTEAEAEPSDDDEGWAWVDDEEQPKPAAEPAPGARSRFRRWRRSRPFWGAFFMLLAGLEVALIPLGAYKIVLVAPSVAIASAIGWVIVVLGIVSFMTPSQNKLYGLLGILAGALSFVMSNLGGFMIGGILTVIGGALTFAWTPLPPDQQPAPPGVEPVPPEDRTAAPPEERTETEAEQTLRYDEAAAPDGRHAASPEDDADAGTSPTAVRST